MTAETASLRPQELPWKDVMRNLQAQVGRRVSIHWASEGSQGIRAGILIEVKPFQSVKIDDFEIPFISIDAAIQKISGQVDTLYHIPYISEMYGMRREDEVKSFRKFVFRGEDRVDEES